jgi:thioredoxin reductase (NADPH)
MKVPVVDANLETKVPGLYLAGSIIEAECIRVAANQGHRVAERVAGLVGALGPAPEGAVDLLIAGAGPAGLNAAFTAKALRLKVSVFDQYFLASTILAMPAGKIFEPNYKGNNDPGEGPLWFESTPIPILHSKWTDQVREHGLTINDNEPITNIIRDEDSGLFEVFTSCQIYSARFVLLCIGKSGHPRTLGVPGETDLAYRKKLHYRYRGPETVINKDILVVGGGNTAAEAVVGLSKDNHVTLSYRKGEFERLTPKNKAALDGLSNMGTIHIMHNSEVESFDEEKAHLKVNDQPLVRTFDEFFILIGFELPFELLQKIGVQLKEI